MKAILIPSSCDGVWGRGTLLDIKKKYPEFHSKFKDNCYSGVFKIGKIQIHQINEMSIIVIIGTKETWKDKDDLDIFKDAIIRLKSQKAEITSIAIPNEIKRNKDIVAMIKEVYPLVEDY